MHLYILGEIGRYGGLRLKAVKASGGDIPGMANLSKLAMSEMMRLTRDLGLRILWEIAGIRVANSRGVVIEEVAGRSRSANIGLQQGDLIVGVNGNGVRSVDDLNAALTSSAERSSVVLDVSRGRFIYSLTFPMGT